MLHARAPAGACTPRLPRSLTAARRRAPPHRAACRVAAAADGLLPVEQRAAAQHAVDAHVRPGHVVALGTGPMVVLATEYISRLIADGRLAGVTALPTCALAASEAAFYGVPVGALPLVGQTLRVDVMLEQVDCVAERDGTLPFIKGRERHPAQPELLRAQALREAAAVLVALAPAEAVLPELSGSVPILVPADDWEEVAESIDDVFLGDAQLWRRPMSGTADPFGGDRPYISPEGHTIVDLIFEDGLKLGGVPASAAEVCEAIESVPGVLAHGLEARGVTHSAVVAPAPGSTTPRVLLPYLADASEEQRALARGTQ